MNSLVSIITPSYNSEKFIKECIESVITQTHTNWEMLIVDDCSRDDSCLAIKELAKQEGRIKCFLLDKNINQSNPSGVAALLMDGQIIQYKGITAEINTVMIPVRYKDFDQGIIEALLAPYYALNNVDMIVTVSMGRKEFDLERFPGKRRSDTAPDNLNVLSGGSKTAPIISQLNDRLLPGNEFVEFSLPVQAMQQAIGPYKVIDNNKITKRN